MQKLATVCCVLLSVLRCFWVLAVCRDAVRHAWLKMFSSLQPWWKHVGWAEIPEVHMIAAALEETAIRERFRGFFCWLWQPYPFLMWLTVIRYSWSRSEQPAQLIQSSTCYQNPFSFRLRLGKWAQRCQFIFCSMQKCTEISPGCHFLKFFWNLFGFGNNPTHANLFKLLWIDM